jgi:catecholate siderophore receptor
LRAEENAAANPKPRGAYQATYPQDSPLVVQVRRFDIQPGTLDSVLSAFATATGFRIVLVNEGIGNLASPGVSGTLTTDQALQRLLTGTGVTYRITAPDTITLELRGPSGSVEVTAIEPVVTLSSPKYTGPLRTVPQTITVIPHAVIEEQGATTLRDVLRNVPGLTMTAGEGGTPAGDNLTLRGFSARNDLFVDGVRDMGPTSRDPFNIEQVEVVKGPGSAFSGRGSTGGTINLVSKSPAPLPFYTGTLNFGSDETKRATVDVNVPVKALGDRAAFRLNLLGHDSGVAGRDVVTNQRWGAAPSLTLGLSSQTRLTLSYFILEQDNLPDYGIPWVPATHNLLADFRDEPAPVPRDSFYGLTARDHEETRSHLATAKVEHDFSDSLTLRNQFRYGRSTRDSVTTAPRFASNDSLVINRNGPSWITEDDIFDNQTDLRVGFATGKIKHALVTGLALSQEQNIRVTRTVAGAPTTTLFNPDPDQPFNGTTTISPNVGDVTGDSLAAYAFDTLNLGSKWELNGGVRWDRFAVDGVNTAAAPVQRTDRMFSFRGGIVYKPKSNGSFYAALGNSLNPSLEGLSYGTANTSIEPEKTYNIEVGSKWDLLGEKLSVSGALFRVEKTNARTPGLLPDDPPQVLQGRQRVNGIEIGAVGSISSVWKVFGAYTLLDDEIVESNIPAEVGKRLINTPRNSGNIWSTYQIGGKLSLGGGARFVGRRFGNTINTRSVGSYWSLDAMVLFPVGRHIDLRVNLYNLNNVYYFDRLAGGHLIPGVGRSASITTGFRF